MFENIRLAFQGIWSHKMRSFLTMLGIIIGIAAIIAIVSTIKGSNEEIKNNLVGSGNNTVEVKLEQSDYEVTASEMGASAQAIPQISEETKEKILNLAEVEAVTTYTSRGGSANVYFGSKALQNTSLYGIDTSYFATCNYVAKAGRLFQEADYKEFKSVLIMDQTAASSLFEDESPIGKTVEISGKPFVVVGIVQQRTHFEPNINTVDDYYTYSNTSSGMIFMPKATWPVIYNYDEPENCIVKATSTDDMPAAGRKTQNILNDTIQKDLLASDYNDVSYAAKDVLKQAQDIQRLSSTTNMQLLWIAGISLLVGGIGVMNIMLVSVTERTAEIGLKKAIGARKRYILMQFLTEAAVLTSLGGMLGVAGGVGAAYVIHRVSDVAVAIDVPASIIAVAFSMAIGLIFGFLPSVQAANLDPIEALRRE